MALAGRIKVAVLGASGMLGAMLTEVLARDNGFEVVATLRDAAWLESAQAMWKSVGWRRLDALSSSDDDWAAKLAGARWVINAIGVIKPYVHDGNPTEMERAALVNALFPYRLARLAARLKARVLQIATDCVYSGREGDYAESAPHDALDVYGKTKSLGEVGAPHVHHLRCSIIGPEVRNRLSLLEWFRGQRRGAVLQGYTNHIWNGVTTLHFARLCRGIMATHLELPSSQHIVPGDSVTKGELLELFRQAYRRADVRITRREAPQAVRRTLRSENSELNARLWAAAGYASPPTVSRMMEELAGFEFRMSELAQPVPAEAKPVLTGTPSAASVS